MAEGVNQQINDQYRYINPEEHLACLILSFFSDADLRGDEHTKQIQRLDDRSPCNNPDSQDSCIDQDPCVGRALEICLRILEASEIHKPTEDSEFQDQNEDRGLLR